MAGFKQTDECIKCGCGAGAGLRCTMPFLSPQQTAEELESSKEAFKLPGGWYLHQEVSFLMYCCSCQLSPLIT